ncbi:unknown protein [Seminavis robusta]|uniref:Uncharacterized protein n=1 Tax=Seminavis robusta TaxID=568900 RepID=A0A9N8HGT3_9STRA|nr:unknown protein [Seminavis robusta]|eukprot:Sro658_g182640.1 n/a (281) ;mRNA; f:1571-2413
MMRARFGASLFVLVAMEAPWRVSAFLVGRSNGVLRRNPLALRKTASSKEDEELDNSMDQRREAVYIGDSSTFPLLTSLNDNPLLNPDGGELKSMCRDGDEAVEDSALAPALLALAGCTYALSSATLWMLYHFEWFQMWRYLWPLVGLLYATDSASSLLGRNKPPDSGQPWPLLSIPSDSSKIPVPVRMLSGVAGVGLLVGGAYDAWMPVWETGPNVFTAAGIGQDSAMILWIITAALAVRRPPKEFAGRYFWTYVVLLSQLYILGDSAFDEVVSTVMELQ